MENAVYLTVMSKKSKTTKLKKLTPNSYQIYGIFDFVKKKLIYVNLSLEETELEFDLEFDLSDYDRERYDIVEFSVVIV
jgi:hypothetical protein